MPKKSLYQNFMLNTHAKQEPAYINNIYFAVYQYKMFAFPKK